MAATKLTPRQKMINMLYLVLTAILALNVSSEVLDAFKSVNQGINLSNNSQQLKNSGVFAELARQYNIDPKRAKDAYDKAQKARDLSKKLNDLLEQYKQQMIAEAGGIDPETGKIHHDDDINIATRMFAEEGSTKGKELKKQITDTRMQLLGLLSEGDRKSAEQSLALKIDEPKTGQWEYATFNSVPVVAAVTMLSKYQNDVLNAEGSVVERLYKSINGTGTTIVDQMAAKVISPSSYILQGESYQADVMVAASSSTLTPDVFIGSFGPGIKKEANGQYAKIESKSDAVPLINPVKLDVEDGLGKMKVAGSSTGEKKYTGVVRVKNSSTGNFEFYPFEGEYQVAAKTAVVSPTMMNVMYIGLDNPVGVSVPGIAQSDITPVLDGPGKLIKNADGTYNARVTAKGNIKIKVNAKVNGRVMEMGEQQFRVKAVPDPESKLDGVYASGKLSKIRMKNTRGVVALVKNFDYPTKFTVLSYDFLHYSKKNGNVSPPVHVTGPSYNLTVLAMLPQIDNGDDVFIDNIKVMGPAGDTRTIDPITIAIVQ